jgi:hypothetical protein
VVRVIGVFLFASPARANLELRWLEYSAIPRFPLWDLPHRKHRQKKPGFLEFLTLFSRVMPAKAGIQ